MLMRSHRRSRRALGRWTAAALCLILAPSGEAVDDRLPSGAVSLEDALAAALLHNPELATYPFEIRAEEARALQEGLLPNPSLSTEVENFGRFGGGGDGVEKAQTTVSLTQLFELGGKRTKRRSLAKLDSEIAGWDYERARLDTATKTL